jgi:hypothetical protein
LNFYTIDNQQNINLLVVWMHTFAKKTGIPVFVCKSFYLSSARQQLALALYHLSEKLLWQEKSTPSQAIFMNTKEA